MSNDTLYQTYVLALQKRTYHNSHHSYSYLLNHLVLIAAGNQKSPLPTSSTENKIGDEAILYYDHVITFDDEFRRIWKGPRKLNFFLFMINRYLKFFTVSYLIDVDVNCNSL